MNSFLSSLPIAIAIVMSSAIFAFLIYKRPGMVTKIRVNLLWLSTLVAILTLVFGIKLIELLQSSSGNTSTNTIEIVLSSLVGVGIGGLIAIAGQLVQDSDNDSSNANPPDNHNNGSNETG